MGGKIDSFFDLNRATMMQRNMLTFRALGSHCRNSIGSSSSCGMEIQERAIGRLAPAHSVEILQAGGGSGGAAERALLSQLIRGLLYICVHGCRFLSGKVREV